jgi:pantothenate kinase type III
VLPQRLPSERWPIETPAAMLQGCAHSVVAAIVQAWRDAQLEEPAQRWSLWLTGGDAELLRPLLVQQQLDPVVAPDLVMQALAALPVVGLLP